MQIVNAIALVNTSSPILIADIGQDLLGISALAANSMTTTTAARITVWQQLNNGQRFAFLTNKVLPSFGAFYFSDLVKGCAFFPGDKLYASVSAGEAMVSFNLYAGTKNQRLASA
jgi:hypothetical protein